VFWIDQICIDQEGDEKNHQVAMMGAIYKNAERVITYIGPAKDDEEEKVGMELIQRLHKHFEPNYKLIFKISNLKKAWQRRAELPVTERPRDLQGDDDVEGIELKRAIATDPYVVQGWRRLCEVAFGEWAQRLWMVQEQILNHEAVMLRGSQLLLWDAVAVMSILFYIELLPGRYYQRLWMESRPQGHLSRTSIARSVYSMWHDRRRKTLIRHGTSESDDAFDVFLLNLIYYRELECQDQRVGLSFLRAIFLSHAS
jgi:Heterokaryon incompatibility protein (HET)